MGNMTTGEPLLTSSEVASLLQVHPKQIYRLLKRGLPGHRMGGEWRFVREEILAWVGEREPARAADSDAPADQPPASDHAALLAANGDVLIELLLAQLNREPAAALFGFVRADRDRALAWLESGAILAAGCHGGLPPSRLGGLRLARLHLAGREIGLAAPRGRFVPALADISPERLGVRPRSAGLFLHLEEAARREGLYVETLLANGHVCASHQEVVEAIARGEVDAGLTTRAWAKRLGLSFRVLASESYGLLLRAHDLGDPRVVRLCEAAQSADYRQRLAATPGYDPAGCGDIRYDPEPAAA